MGLLNEVGTALGFAANRVWKLASIDRQGDQEHEFAAQFTAEGLTEDVGAKLGQEQPLGSEQPGIHLISNDSNTIKFRAKIFRTSPVEGLVFDALADPVGTAFGGGNPAFGSVKLQIDKLKSFSQKDAELGRLERFLFTWGVEMAFEVLVHSVGGIRYDELRSDGTIRGASFEITMEKIKQRKDLENSDISLAAQIKTTLGIVTTVAGAASSLGAFGDESFVDIPGGSPHRVTKRVVAKAGDTFESIARREYGNATLGEVLRRAQPELLDLKAGDTVKLIRRAEALQIALTPQSIALRDRPENFALVEGFLALRGKKAAVVA